MTIMKGKKKTTFNKGIYTSEVISKLSMHKASKKFKRQKHATSTKRDTYIDGT